MTPTVYLASDNSPVDLEKIEGLALVVAVPAAFSPTCSRTCVPNILEQEHRIFEAGVTQLFIVSSDQPFAINAWAEAEGWLNNDAQFASDFGNFELRDIVGKLGDEAGKEDLPPLLDNLLRRGYLLVKDGKIVWKYMEPDTIKFSLNFDELLKVIEENK